MFTQSFPPADDAVALILSIADKLRSVDWKRRTDAGILAVLTVVAFVHALSIRLAPHLLEAASNCLSTASYWLAAMHFRAKRAADAAAERAPEPVAVAPLASAPRSAATLTVLELRELARAHGIKTTADGRRVGSANRAALLAALA
jgi:hypothetical protein